MLQRLYFRNSFLVSLYEWAPTLKGEKDKTQPKEKPMEMDKE